MCGVNKNGKIEMSLDELEELVTKLMDKRDAQRMASGVRRDPFTSFTDPDGKTWLSATLNKAEVVRKAWAAILLFGAILGGINFVLTTYVARPVAREEAATQIAEHNKAAREEMQKIATTLVYKPEFDAYKASRDERWATQTATNQRIEASLVEMQKDIKELLKRVR